MHFEIFLQTPTSFPPVVTVRCFDGLPFKHDLTMPLAAKQRWPSILDNKQWQLLSTLKYFFKLLLHFHRFCVCSFRRPHTSLPRRESRKLSPNSQYSDSFLICATYCATVSTSCCLFDFLSYGLETILQSRKA